MKVKYLDKYVSLDTALFEIEKRAMTDDKEAIIVLVTVSRILRELLKLDNVYADGTIYSVARCKAESAIEELIETVGERE